MNDDSRSIDLSIEVSGTPEEVWAAIATGPGVSSWFMPVRIAEEVGGKVEMDLGGVATETGTVTAWEPPHRVVFEGSESRGRRLAYEWLVEARGGTCVVRLVNSGFGLDADWDGDYDGMTGGWTIFMESLRLHLTHFRGRQARTTVPTAMLGGPNRAAWSAFCSALGVPAASAAGDRIETSGPGVPPLAAVVEQAIEQPAVTARLLVLEGPAPGTAFLAAEGDGDQVACSVFLYLYGDAAAEVGPRWDAWMARTFPAPAEVGA